MPSFPIRGNLNSLPLTQENLSQTTIDSTLLQSELGRNYETRPLTLDDVKNNRLLLKTSPNEATRTLGSYLEKIHNDLYLNIISEDQHLNMCHKILEAAEMLAGTLDAEYEILKEFSLHNKLDLKINPSEYLAISEDLGRQLNKGNGIIAIRRILNEDARRASIRGRSNIERMTNPQLENLGTDIITRMNIYRSNYMANSRSSNEEQARNILIDIRRYLDRTGMPSSDQVQLRSQMLNFRLSNTHLQ